MYAKTKMRTTSPRLQQQPHHLQLPRAGGRHERHAGLRAARLAAHEEPILARHGRQEPVDPEVSAILTTSLYTYAIHNITLIYHNHRVINITCYVIQTIV